MAVGGAVQVEGAGVGETRGIPVRRTQQCDHPAAARHLVPAQVRVLVRPARHRLHRRVVAQEFLDRTRRQLGIGAELFQGLRVRPKCQDRLRQEVGRGLVSGGQQMDAGPHQSVRAQRCALLLGADEAREQVPARVVGA
ncbi:hypothetical protein SF23_02175, partial [Streptomyces sp. MBRL 10]